MSHYHTYGDIYISLENVQERLGQCFGQTYAFAKSMPLPNDLLYPRPYPESKTPHSLATRRSRRSNKSSRASTTRSGTLQEGKDTFSFHGP